MCVDVASLKDSDFNSTKKMEPNDQMGSPIYTYIYMHALPDFKLYKSNVQLKSCFLSKSH